MECEEAVGLYITLSNLSYDCNSHVKGLVVASKTDYAPVFVQW